MCLVYSAPSNIKIDDFVSRIFTESNALVSITGQIRVSNFFFFLFFLLFFNPVGLDLTFLV